MWCFPDIGTHLPVICRAFAELGESRGDVLELGCGDFSTPMLHELCVKRKLISIDNEELWYNRFLYLWSTWHSLHLVKSWTNLPEYDKKWDIAFIDLNPAYDRKIAISALSDNAKIIIAHDSEDLKNAYGYQYCIGKFKFYTQYKRHKIETLVLSNFIDVTNWWSF